MVLTHRMANRWLMCSIFILIIQTSISDAFGGIFSTSSSLYASESPYIVDEDVVITETGRLTIEPGVVLKFNPGIGLIVRGVLNAKGTIRDRILLTAFGEKVHTPAKKTLRLAGGSSSLEGRLQLNHKNKWRSVCTNSRNWTATDVNVVCQELGFAGGQFSRWFDGHKDDSRLLWEKPACSGVEEHLHECDWVTRKMGSGVCDLHPDIGIRCNGTYYSKNYPALNHWKGLSFVNAAWEYEKILDNTVRRKISKSVLEYVDISYAGLGNMKDVSSAVATEGVPPRMFHVSVSNSAHDGINILSPGTGFAFTNITLAHNKGYGLYVNTSHGDVNIKDSLIESNENDGIHYEFHDTKLNQMIDEQTLFDICRDSAPSAQIYPVFAIAQQYAVSGWNHLYCPKVFRAKAGQVLTVRIAHIETAANDKATIEIRDGPSEASRLLQKISIRNETYPLSVTSTKNEIFVKYVSEPNVAMVTHLVVSSGNGKTPDIVVADSIVRSNNGRGIVVSNMRSNARIEDSSITNNTHVSGIHIVDGSGDVNVTSCRILNNVGDGVNITTRGGARNITSSQLIGNQGYGLAVFLNESTNNFSLRDETVVSYNVISDNLRAGFLMGNYCRPSFVNISSNVFNASHSLGIKLLTCWNEANGSMEINIGHNILRDNYELVTLIEPSVNIKGLIHNNLYERNHKGCEVIRSSPEYDVILDRLPCNLTIQDNNYYDNTGQFVVKFELYSYAENQKLVFTRNFMKNNKVTNPFPSLNFRLRQSAVVVVGCINCDIYRNIIDNRLSVYEIASSLEEQGYEINATHNWLGSKSDSILYGKIFDRKDRYSLAKIQYKPYLLLNNDPETDLISDGYDYIPDFNSGTDGVIGGELTGQEILAEGVFTVNRDILVHPGGVLKIAFGTTLRFNRGIGMMVGGKLHAEGTGHGSFGVKFTLLDNMIENSTIPPVRLVGGKTRFEGRVEVNINSTWGTVCDYGWNQLDAALVCNQLGLALNPSDWFLEKSEMPSDNPSNEVVLSNVKCSPYDTNILDCQAERNDDFENSCGHGDDVGIRCSELGWSGVRIGMTAEKTTMKYVTIEKAGMFDAGTSVFKPALQIDNNHHVLENIIINQNAHDGLGITMPDFYRIDKGIKILKNATISNNRGHGISLKSLDLTIRDCEITDNGRSGIHFEPMITRKELRELKSWLGTSKKRFYFIPVPWDDSIKLTLGESIDLHILPSNTTSNVEYRIETDPELFIGCQVLVPFFPHGDDDIEFIDFPDLSGVTKVIKMRNGLIHFPRMSLSNSIVLRYMAGKKGVGGMVMKCRSVRRSEFGQDDNVPPHPTLIISHAEIKRNRRGVSLVHFNRYMNEVDDYYLRHNNETISIRDLSEIGYNTKEAVFVHGPFQEQIISGLAEIRISVNDSVIHYNGKGVVQFSRDFRLSNNLFHWVLENNQITSNDDGGVEIMLPYVWQYNENYTHTIFVANNVFKRNENFRYWLDGHFCELSVLNNTFNDNKCPRGLMSIKGMEKLLFIDSNRFDQNFAPFVVEFELDSQSSILGAVEGYFTRNTVQNNKYEAVVGDDNYQPVSYSLGLKGIQKINVTYNIFDGNELHYEMLAGLETATLDNYVNARENWWGSRDLETIRKKIFDFDDWNSFAVAQFIPYYIDGYIGAQLSSGINQVPEMQLENLGGRMFNSLVLDNIENPYVIKSDLTVMPGATLRIEPGVSLEFFPSVGLLILGSLYARGTERNRITMKPHKTPDVNQNESFQQTENARLCQLNNCTSHLNTGFLEIYNSTTLQWVPVCDPRFSHRDAEVVCRQLGFLGVNVYHTSGERIEFHQNSLNRITSWVEPLQCSGKENNYLTCEKRLNGKLFETIPSCDYDSKNFVFLYCGEKKDSDDFEYWGGIRFSVPNFEDLLHYPSIHNTETHHTSHVSHNSILEYVDIIGAGILHGEKSAAVQSVVVAPKMYHNRIFNCCSDAISIIAPRNDVKVMYNILEDNIGMGVNTLLLTGESRESSLSSFNPVMKSTLPYNVFGLVDICDTNKVLEVEERVLLYHKYDNRPVDCVKIFNSPGKVNNFGFRLLQFHLWNSSIEMSGVPDQILLYDGDIFNETAKLISQIITPNFMQENNHSKFYMTESTSLSVQFHSTGAGADYGFIAEIMALPAATIGIDRGVHHNISYNIVRRNQKGAVLYMNSGEVNPSLTLEWNQFDNNGIKLYENFTTVSDGAVSLFLQNTRQLRFMNNLLRNNQGGLYVHSQSSSSATALEGIIRNCLFTDTQSLPALSLIGTDSPPFQTFNVAHNYFTRSYSPHHFTIKLNKVLSNFSYNYIYNNEARFIMGVYGFDKVKLPMYQTILHNGFYWNRGLDRDVQATVVAGSAGQQYLDNVFYNPDNDLEMMTVNESSSEIWKTPVNAKHNWWGYNSSYAISARIKDNLDDPGYLQVDYEPYRLSNVSLLDGKCPPNWSLVGNTCYMYFGGPMTFYEAKDFCRLNNASMPYLQGHNYDEITDKIFRIQYDFHRYDMVWVQHYDDIGKCTVLSDNTVIIVDCHHVLPFLCEADPNVTLDPLDWVSDTVIIAALAATCIAIILIVMVISFWILKSKYRYKEKLERRNSIRASIRSNRTAFTNGLADFSYRRGMMQNQGVMELDNFKLNGSIDTYSEKPPILPSFDGHSYDAHMDDGYLDDRFAHDPRMENETVNAMVHPTFDITYENQGFRAAPSEEWSPPLHDLTLTTDEKRSLQSEQMNSIHTVSTLDVKRDSDTKDSASHRSSSAGSDFYFYRAPSQPLETAM